MEDAANACGYDFNGVQSPETPSGIYGLMYATFVPSLVKALQEQQAIIDELENAVANKSLTKVVMKQGEGEADFQKDVILKQNRPNPFTMETTIEYVVPESAGPPMIEITDLNGSLIQNHPMPISGAGSISVKAGSLPPGLYLYRLVAGNHVLDSKRMILLAK